jgi:hypothetical protein
MTIQAGNPYTRVIVHLDVYTYETILATQILIQGAGYSFKFAFYALSAWG